MIDPGRDSWDWQLQGDTVRGGRAQEDGARAHRGDAQAARSPASTGGRFMSSVSCGGDLSTSQGLLRGVHGVVLSSAITAPVTRDDRAGTLI